MDSVLSLGKCIVAVEKIAIWVGIGSWLEEDSLRWTVACVQILPRDVGSEGNIEKEKEGMMKSALNFIELFKSKWLSSYIFGCELSL